MTRIYCDECNREIGSETYWQVVRPIEFYNARVVSKDFCQECWESLSAESESEYSNWYVLDAGKA
jgi:hypothetical protein